MDGASSSPLAIGGFLGFGHAEPAIPEQSVNALLADYIFERYRQFPTIKDRTASCQAAGVRTYTALVDDARVARVLVHVLAVLHHRAEAVLAGGGEHLEASWAAAVEEPLSLGLRDVVSAELRAFLAAVGVLRALVDVCKVQL